MTTLKEEEVVVGIKKRRGLNIYALLVGILIFCALLTYVVPAGFFERSDFEGRSIIVAESYSTAEATPVSPLELLTSIPAGLVDSAAIIFFILIIGGSFAILNATGTTEALIVALTRSLGDKEKLLIPILMLFFALNGSLLGAFEETLPYIVIIVPLMLALGFDALTGVAIVLVGVSVGFTAAIMNPFTIGVAQRIAELPPYSGMGFRIIIFTVMYIVAVLFVYRYAMKVRKDPSIGVYGTLQIKTRDELLGGSTRLTGQNKAILAAFVLTLATIAFGVTKYEWYIYEIAGIFLLFGIIIGFIARINTHDWVDEFMKGAAMLIPGVLIIGLARSIIVVLEQGQVMDTILYHISNLITQMPGSFTAIGMLILQSLISFIIPSGSGMAALTMPIMSPLAELVGVTRQTAILAYQFGDGIWNLIVPGVAIAGVALVGIPFSKWVRFVFPLLCIQFVIAAVFIIIAQAISYGPF